MNPTREELEGWTASGGNSATVWTDRARAARYALELRAEVDRLRAVLRAERDDLTECLCGCPLADHESYDEDGIACGCDGHECLPVWPTVAVTLRSLRARLAVAERVIEDLATDAHGSRAARALAEWEAGKA